MTGATPHTIRVIVDPLVWQVPLFILGIAAALGFVYLLRIHIAYRMAKSRHRDPVGWVLLSLFLSPLLSWIALLIVGDNTHARPGTN